MKLEKVNLGRQDRATVVEMIFATEGGFRHVFEMVIPDSADAELLEAIFASAERHMRAAPRGK